ncbi:MAG: hypothetical protein ACR2MB_09845 [Acidimicrobiales bacterium]
MLVHGGGPGGQRVQVCLQRLDLAFHLREATLGVDQVRALAGADLVDHLEAAGDQHVGVDRSLLGLGGEVPALAVSRCHLRVQVAKLRFQIAARPDLVGGILTALGHGHGPQGGVEAIGQGPVDMTEAAKNRIEFGTARRRRALRLAQSDRPSRQRAAGDAVLDDLGELAWLQLGGGGAGEPVAVQAEVSRILAVASAAVASTSPSLASSTRRARTAGLTRSA